MTLSTSLRSAARTLIDTFGNSGTVFSYSGITSSFGSEGDLVISDWGIGSVIKIIDGSGLKEQLSQADQGFESIAEDEKMVRDDAVVEVNDRVELDGVDFKIQSVAPIRSQDTVIVHSIVMTRTGTVSQW